MSKRITEKRLYNITLAYLSRFESSTSKVRAMLNRRLMKEERNGIEIPAEAMTWIENVIHKMESLGYLNDTRYTENRVRSLSRAGRSKRFMIQKLTQDGIDTDTVKNLLDSDEMTEADRARRFVARKKLGPFRPADKRGDYRQKDLAALARAGFSYQVACAALETPVSEDDGFDF